MCLVYDDKIIITFNSNKVKNGKIKKFESFFKNIYQSRKLIPKPNINLYNNL